MRSPGINREGELRGQPANPGSPGKMAIKTECVCVCMPCWFYSIVVLLHHGRFIDSLCPSSAFKKWQKLFGTIVQTSKVDKQCIFCTTGTGFHAMNLIVSIAGQNTDLWWFLWQHNQVLIVNLFPRRLQHIGKLSEKWTRMFSEWHSGFQIRNIFHICSISPTVTCTCTR